MGNDDRFSDKKKPREYGSKARKEEMKDKDFDSEAIADFDSELGGGTERVCCGGLSQECKKHGRCWDHESPEMQPYFQHPEQRQDQSQLRRRKQERAAEARCRHDWTERERKTYWRITFIYRHCRRCGKSGWRVESE